jgi:hypothetical protein
MSIGDNGMEDDAQSADQSAFPPKNPKNEVYDSDDPTWPMVVVQWRDAHAGGDASWTFTDGYEAEVEIVGDINHIPWENIVNVYSLAIHMPVNWNQELD